MGGGLAKGGWCAKNAPMSVPLTTIRNIGPATAAEFAAVGIHDADTLRQMGADAAYLRLLEGGARAHFIAYYVLVMGLQDRPWNDCKGAEKAALRARFDELKAQSAARPGAGDARLDAALAAIGVVPGRKAGA
jgi:DNA transformation protein and related proteins